MNVKRVYLIIAVITLLFSVMVSAQDVAATEELLSYLPYGSYRTLDYMNLAEMRKAESFPLFERQFFRMWQQAVESELPSELTALVAARAAGQAMRIADPARMEKLELRAKRQMETQGKAKNAARLVKMAAIQDTAVVYRIDGLAGQWPELVKNNVFVAEEKLTKELTIYAYSVNGRMGTQSRLAVPVGPDLLLVASKKQTLQAMIAAGAGMELIALDNPDYRDLTSTLAGLGQCWRMQVNQRQFAVFTGEAEADGAPQTSAPYMSITEYIFADKEFTEHSIKFHITDEQAEEQLSRSRQPLENRMGLPPEIMEQRQRVHSARQYRLDGSIVHSSLVWSEELMETYMNAMIDMKTWMVEKEKDAAKKAEDPPSN